MARSWWLLPMACMAGAALADPPPVKRSAVVARAELMFAKADTDHDGYLSREEYHVAILARAKQFDAKVTPQGMAAADAQFDRIDTAHTGRISRADFVAAAVGHFDSADLNQDGVVTPDEARKAAKLMQKGGR